MKRTWILRLFLSLMEKSKKKKTDQKYNIITQQWFKHILKRTENNTRKCIDIFVFIYDFYFLIELIKSAYQNWIALK